jgi:hypothetical protein
MRHGALSALSGPLTSTRTQHTSDEMYRAGRWGTEWTLVEGAA